MEKNFEILNKIYIDAFDFFKKNGSKKDKNYQKIKDISTEIRNFSTNFTSFEKIRTYSLILCQPFDQCDLKILDKIITTIDIVLTKNLIDSSILQEMIDILFSFLHHSNIFDDDNFNRKILTICQKIYITESLSIHDRNVKYILQIFLNIYLSGKNPQIQQLVRSTLSQIIDYMIKKIEKNLFELQSRSDKLYQDRINYHNEISKVHLNLMVDIIEIAKNDKINNDIVNKVAIMIKEGNYENIINFIELLKLEQIENFKNEIEAPIGKYGWCTNCRNTSNNYSNKLHLPICSNINCESEIDKLLSAIDNEYKLMNNPFSNDYIILISNLVKYSTTESKTKNEGNFVYSKCHEFCLEMMIEMIDKGSEFFSNNEKIIELIKDNLMDSLVKNTLSNAINSLKLSIKLFIVIIKKYREHLKAQIDIFFNKVLLIILESENMSYEYKVVILDALNDLVTDCTFIVEIYVNFDCDVNYKAVFYELLNLLTKIINGLYKKQKYAYLFKPNQERTLKIKCFDFLTKFVQNLSTLVKKNIREYTLKLEEESTQLNSNQNDNSNEITLQYSDDITQSNDPSTPFFNQLKNKITQSLKVKALLSTAIIKFNIYSPSKCLDFLKEQGLIYNELTFKNIKEKYIKIISNPNDIHPHSTGKNIVNNESNNDDLLLDSFENINIMQTPFISNINPLFFLLHSLDNIQQITELKYKDFIAFEMARFIKSNIKVLNREKAGEYLCSGKDFNRKVLEYFINSFEFKKMHIIEALRALFTEFHLVGESQIVDRVVQIFGYKYHKENPNFLKNPDICYYLAYSIIILNTDLHREEVEKKMTYNEYVQNFSLLCPKNEKLPDKLLEDVYNRVLNSPLTQSGQKINSKKNKLELIQEEKAKIIKSTVEELKTQNISSISSNYNMKIDNRDIKNLVDCSWSNFLGIFSQLLADFDDEKIVIACVDNILKMARICLILHLDTISEAFINSIINATNLSDGREVTLKSTECIIGLVEFCLEYGQYIRTCWYNILLALSKIDFYNSFSYDSPSFIDEFTKRSKGKNAEREIEIEKKNSEIIKKCRLDMKCDSIYSKTNSFKEESILNFVSGLCKVSIFELSNYYYPRVYSLHKLVEVADFNIFRIQIEWVKIWKNISEHLTYVITSSKHEMIWREALDSLKQTICKLLQKPDLSVYNFQKDFFKPFEVIFSQTINSPTRGEMVLSYIYYIVGTYTKFIHSGWIVIFDILKVGLKRKNDKMNEDIKNTLQKISDDFSLFNSINPEVFTRYIGCLCHMYLDNNLKQYAFDTILNLLSKIVSDISEEKDDKDKNSLSVIEKKYEFLKIFLYGFDDLIKTNVIEHLNLIFEILSHNMNIIFSSEDDSLVYLYYCYFKPHLIVMLFYPYINDLFFIEVQGTKFKNFHLTNEEDNIEYNIKVYLEDSIDKIINGLKKEESNEYKSLIKENDKEKAKILSLEMKGMKKSYNKDIELMSNKLKIIEQLEEKDYEYAISFFLEKIYALLSSIKDTKINYIYFYEDLVLSMQLISIFNSKSNIILSILSNWITSFHASLSDELLVKLQEQNLLILTILSTQKKLEQQQFSSWLNYCHSFISFLSEIISKYSENTNKNTIFTQSNSSVYKMLNIIQSQILKSDIENDYKKFSLINSKIGLEIIALIQKTKEIIIKNTKELKELSDNSGFYSIGEFYKIFEKYKLSSQEKSNIFSVIQFELDAIMPNFLNKMKKEELEIVFNCLIGFIDSKNTKLRASAKTLLKQFIKDKLCIFNPCKDE